MRIWRWWSSTPWHWPKRRSSARPPAERYHSYINSLARSTSSIPPGRWAVAVSGGADSVALLRLIHAHRPDIAPHVVHLDHQTRGQFSTNDAQFVATLANNLAIPHSIVQRSRIEASLTRLPANASSRYRAARLELFRQVVAEHYLLGVILAHHADDQAETVLLRLLRGSAPAGLIGMSPQSHLGRLLILRPLLTVDGKDLRDYLRAQNQDWREDASNASPKYLRNRLRPMLQNDPALRAALLALADACHALKDWTMLVSPTLPPEFSISTLRDLPPTLARESARRWLISAGSPPAKLSEHVLSRLVQMAADAATPARQHFPGRVQVGRRAGVISPTVAPPNLPIPIDPHRDSNDHESDTASPT